MSSHGWEFSSVDPERTPPELDVTVPHSARMWNYWLGGKDNYAADRAAARQVMNVFPGIVDDARASRAFLARAVRHLTREEGIRQFLDIGTGLPTANNTHEVAQEFAPESKIVYVDNDPLVLVHARALLTSSPEGATAYIDADVRETDTILTEAAKVLDFSQPVGLMMLGILGNIPEYEQARSPLQIEAYFEGMELLEPGVVPTSRWRPDPSQFGEPPMVDVCCGVARKP
jgi:hypothetical protein